MNRLKAKFAYTVAQLHVERGLPPWYEVPLCAVEAAAMCCGLLLVYLFINPQTVAVPRVLAVVSGLVITPLLLVITPFAYYELTTEDIWDGVRHEKWMLKQKK